MVYGIFWFCLDLELLIKNKIPWFHENNRALSIFLMRICITQLLLLNYKKITKVPLVFFKLLAVSLMRNWGRCKAYYRRRAWEISDLLPLAICMLPSNWYTNVSATMVYLNYWALVYSDFEKEYFEKFIITSRFLVLTQSDLFNLFWMNVRFLLRPGFLLQYLIFWIIPGTLSWILLMIFLKQGIFVSSLYFWNPFI